MKSNKLLVIITLLIILLGIGGYSIYRHKTVSNLPAAIRINTENQPTLGDPAAKAQIVAFEDLKCIACKGFNDTQFSRIKSQLVDTKKAKYTIILLGFIPGSIPAANAAYCLREQNDNYFFQFIEHVYAHQPPEEQDWATPSQLLLFAKAAAPQANLNKLSACMVSGKYNNRISQNNAYAMQVMQGQLQTPTLYVNGVYANPRTFKNIETLVETTKNSEK